MDYGLNIYFTGYSDRTVLATWKRRVLVRWIRTNGKFNRWNHPKYCTERNSASRRSSRQCCTDAIKKRQPYRARPADWCWWFVYMFFFCFCVMFLRSNRAQFPAEFTKTNGDGKYIPGRADEKYVTLTPRRGKLISFGIYILSLVTTGAHETHDSCGGFHRTPPHGGVVRRWVRWRASALPAEVGVAPLAGVLRLIQSGRSHYAPQMCEWMIGMQVNNECDCDSWKRMVLLVKTIRHVREIWSL